MQKQILAFIVLAAAILVGHINQLASGRGANLGESLGFGLACAAIPLIAIYRGALVKGFFGGLILCTLLLTQQVAPPVCGALILALLVYGIAYAASAKFRSRVKELFARIGFGEGA